MSVLTEWSTASFGTGNSKRNHFIIMPIFGEVCLRRKNLLQGAPLGSCIARWGLKVKQLEQLHWSLRDNPTSPELTVVAAARTKTARASISLRLGLSLNNYGTLSKT